MSIINDIIVALLPDSLSPTTAEQFTALKFEAEAVDVDDLVSCSNRVQNYAIGMARSAILAQ